MVQMNDISFVPRIHVDIADGKLAPKLLELTHMTLPKSMEIDIHVMHKEPLKILKELISNQPSLVIVHAEADGNFADIARPLKKAGIRVGVALLQETDPEVLRPALELIDHVLIFSGHLGHFGGHADLKLLDKVTKLKTMKPSLEIGWDGGINEDNVTSLVAGGIDVLNAGGFIHGAKDSKAAYATLVKKAES
jgi:ribulose-phosphate 3-epimerase